MTSVATILLESHSSRCECIVDLVCNITKKVVYKRGGGEVYFCELAVDLH